MKANVDSDVGVIKFFLEGHERKGELGNLMIFFIISKFLHKENGFSNI